MPEPQPGESLILHVKGTTAETKEMPKKAIRTAIKEGKITHSQLIWSAEEHRWKQVRELPELLPARNSRPLPPAGASAGARPQRARFAACARGARGGGGFSHGDTEGAAAVVGPPRVTIAPANGEASAPNRATLGGER